MFITVRLITGFKKPLTYRVPDQYAKDNLVGRLVQVPLRNRLVPAFVERQFDHFQEQPTFTIKELKSLHTFPLDNCYMPFITQLSEYQQIDPLIMLKRLIQFLATEKKHDEPNQDILEETTKVLLTNDQQKIYNSIAEQLKDSSYTPNLLHGVTGSGKTEIYKKLLTKNYNYQKSSIVLLPEVTLALQFEQHFKKTLSIPVYSFHSGTTAKEKRILWQLLLKSEPIVIIGVHLPLMLPISNLGLIIVDEEHEAGYQEKKHPKINTKEGALFRAQLYKIPILLGSATPSLSSLYNVTKRNWNFFQLTKRYTGSFPQINIVQLLENKNKRRNFWISKELENAVSERLQKKEQSIIFLNRRGICFFVQCKTCSHTFSCSHCSVSLTLHNNNELRCHYCGYTTQMPTICPSCKKTSFLKKGVGTQQIVSVLEKLFPKARIARADLDTTVKKKQWQQTIEQFNNGEIDIIVGTQTITKGYHFPGVTLVGILWAELNLNFPIFNAAETTLQQLIQVAGRAGRANKNSLVIVQTMANHDIFRFINEVDYLKFYQTEIKNRELLSYPPCGRLAEIELINNNENIVEKEAQKIVGILSYNKNITILGPSAPPVAKIKNKYRRRIYIKSKSFFTLIDSYKKVRKIKLQSHLYFTPQPLN